MHTVGRRLRAALIPLPLALLLAWLPEASQAHGGVVAEDDQCIINIGYLQAHFKIYVPQVSGHREYCEDIPVAGESVFVMEYLHDGLATTPIEFRIIRNTTGKGTFARLADVQALPDLEAVTVRYVPPVTLPDVYMLLHDFVEDGEYIGIVSAGGKDADRHYTAVFPFAVGSTGAGIWPWVVAALVLLQLQFWWSRRRGAGATVAALILLLPTASPAVDGTTSSENGWFVVTYASSLEPLEANRMHTWRIELRDRNGMPVDSAGIRIEGGMPLHDHGLPTAPQAVPVDGAGNYRLDGLRFHMPGEWELVLTIDDGTHTDRVVVRFTV